MNMNLPFIVSGAATEEIAFANAGFKWRRCPQFQRLWGLHIVMPVEKDGGFTCSLQRFSIDQRVQLGWYNLDLLETRAPRTISNPLAGSLDVRLVLALSAHTGNAQQF